MTRFKSLCIGLIIANSIALLVGGYITYNKDLLGFRMQSAQKQPIPSRLVMEYVQQVVKDTKPAPTVAARAYAYVASTYSDTLRASDQSNALLAAQQMMNVLYPEKKATTAKAFVNIHQVSKIKQVVSLKESAKVVFQKYEDRTKQDGFTMVWDGKIPTGAGKWRVERNKQPATPMAGQWKRWVIAGNITVPPPPAYGSSADLQQLAIVQNAVKTRDGEGVALVNFWGGTPGTETPSGIWQNQMYKNIKNDLPYDLRKRDIAYATMQMILAQTLSDSFMECWKVKYTYWTARPSMRLANLDLAMDNPPFPSYVSGHSTISKAAAEVLSVLVPEKASLWRQMAVDAKNSRLIGGIHYEIDNEEGFKLGQTVANQVIQAKNLKPMIE